MKRSGVYRLSRKHRRAFTLIELLVALAIIAILIALLVPAALSSRETARDVVCKNNLKQIGMGLENHHVRHKEFPPMMNHQNGGQGSGSWWSWRVMMLPDIDQAALYREFDITVNAFSGNGARKNRETTAARVAVFECPSDYAAREIYFHSFGGATGSVGYAHSNYFGCRGSLRRVPGNGMFPDWNVRIKLDDVTDGYSQTILVGERPVDATGLYGWLAAGTGIDRRGLGDPVLDSAEGLHYGQPATDNSRFHWWSNHSDGANFLFVDGTVRHLSYNIDHQILLKLSTRDGQDKISMSDL